MDDIGNQTVIEEQYDGEFTGLERTNDDETGHTPWNPDQIRVATKTFSLRNVLDMIEEESLELAPDFQRNRVWKQKQKSRLIESVLLQIPLPAFYFAEDADGLLRVVDGLQRLSTINEYVRGTQFPLSDLEYLHEQHDGNRFADLEPVLQRRLNNTQIVAHVIAPTTPPEVMYNIFKRINTLGSPLSSQEIRHSMSNQRSRDFLRRCAESAEFDQATGGSLRQHLRMSDRDVIVRFCAFRLFGTEDYAEQGSMEEFLLKATRWLDDPSMVPASKMEQLSGDFLLSMRNASTVFGQHAFRKWERGQRGRNPINRALFEAWSVALADVAPEDVEARAPQIREAALALMTDDSRYRDAITTSTSDPERVTYRHSQTAKAVQAS